MGPEAVRIQGGSEEGPARGCRSRTGRNRATAAAASATKASTATTCAGGGRRRQSRAAAREAARRRRRASAVTVGDTTVPQAYAGQSRVIPTTPPGPARVCQTEDLAWWHARFLPP